MSADKQASNKNRHGQTITCALACARATHRHTHSCLHTHTHTYTHARARKGAHTQSHACTHTQTQTHSHTQMHTHTRTHTYTHIHTHTHRTHPKHRINYLQLINLGFLFGRSTNKIQITEKKEKSMGSRSLWVTHVWHEDYRDQRVPASLSSVAKQHCKELSPVTLRNSGISIITTRFHSVITR